MRTESTFRTSNGTQPQIPVCQRLSPRQEPSRNANWVWLCNRVVVARDYRWLTLIRVLVVLKLVSGRGKDDEDIKDLLRLADVDVPFIRAQFRRFRNLAGLRTRFEDVLDAIGHPAAKRDYGGS